MSFFLQDGQNLSPKKVSLKFGLTMNISKIINLQIIIHEKTIFMKIK